VWYLNELPAAVWCLNKLTSDLKLQAAPAILHSMCVGSSGAAILLCSMAGAACSFKSEGSLFKHHTAAGSSFKYHTSPHAQPSMADSHSERGGTQARGRRMRQKLNPIWLLHGVRLGPWRWSMQPGLAETLTGMRPCSLTALGARALDAHDMRSGSEEQHRRPRRA